MELGIRTLLKNTGAERGQAVPYTNHLNVLQDAINTMTDNAESIVKSISHAITLSLRTF